MKKLNNILDIQPLVINNIKYEKMLYNVVDNLPDGNIQVNIYKETMGYSLYKIASNVFSPKIVPSVITDRKEIVTILMSCLFNEVECVICHKDISALRMCDSEIGNICFYCWSELTPPIPFVQIPDLEKYVRSEYANKK